MTKDEALRLALEALKSKDGWGSSVRDAKEKAIAACEAALEAKDEPVKAWCETCEGGGKVYQEHQAGCWVGGEHACPDCDGNGYYTTPPQRKPLTDEEMMDCLDEADQMYCERDGDKELFKGRAIEAEHGIKGEE